MKRMQLLVMVLISTTSMFAADVKSAIRAMDDKFEAGVRASSAEQMTSIYTDDAVLMPPNAPAQRGREAIRAFWAGMLAAGKFELNLTIEDVSVSGDMASERGTWALTMTPNGTTTEVKDNGKYLLVWRNKGGKWLAVSDIYNSDNEPPK